MFRGGYMYVLHEGTHAYLQITEVIKHTYYIDHAVHSDPGVTHHFP